MDDFIAIYFSVSPQICAIRYHRPETLDPFDYMFAFKGVREGRRPDGEPYVDSVRSALRGVAFLEPGEHRPLRLRGRTRQRCRGSARIPRRASCCRSGPSRAPSRKRCA